MSRVLKTGQNQITQHYGNRGHSGVDVVKYSGQTDTIIAHSAGKVVFCQKGMTHNNEVGNNASYGNCVKIRHDNGYYTLYAHLADVRVGLGQYVKQGQDLGYMGNTGNSTACHLHFEVFNANNQRINPEPYLDADLPGTSTGYTGKITYQAFANGHWYPEVSKCDNTKNGYAGDKQNFISGVRTKPEHGVIYTQSHVINKGWQSEISSVDYKTNDTKNANSYSGIYNEPIDGINFWCTEGYIDARALTSRGWLPWVRFYNTKSDNYIGNLGEPILAFQMK